eukprot:2089504-Amphidinium_carterae.1
MAQRQSTAAAQTKWQPHSVTHKDRHMLLHAPAHWLYGFASVQQQMALKQATPRHSNLLFKASRMHALDLSWTPHEAPVLFRIAVNRMYAQNYSWQRHRVNKRGSQS